MPPATSVRASSSGAPRRLSGELLGPTIFTSGPKIEGLKSIWPGDLEIGSKQELEAALDQLQGWKVDFVKITDNTLSPELFLAAVQAADKRGLKTSAHVPYSLTLDEVSRAGLDSIEHIDYAFKAGSRRRKRLVKPSAAARSAAATHGRSGRPHST